MLDLQPVFTEIIGAPTNSIALRLHRFIRYFAVGKLPHFASMSIDNTTVKL
jgi:hypothetical protein